MRSPKEVVADLAPQYTTWKSSEKAKNKFRDEFFKSITESIKEGELAERVVTIECGTTEEALDIAQKQNPLWAVVSGRITNRGDYEVLLRENPEYMPFTIEFDGKTWGRQVSSGSTLIDDDKLREENEDLWYEITEFPMEDFVMDLMYESGMEPELVEDFVSKIAVKHGIKRVLRPLDDLPGEVLAQVQEYVYEGKPSVKLPAPRNAEKD